MSRKTVSTDRLDAPSFGRAIPAGLGVNLLVRDIGPAIDFQRAVLGACVTYADADFAVLQAQGAMWMLHADHTYDRHPLTGIVAGADTRGAGAEFRLYGCDPDGAEARARAGGHHVLQGTMDKPHGLRECFLIDPDGYVWVPSVACPP